jgi:glycosyltransferase involved in cell wall biosynthesis
VLPSVGEEAFGLVVAEAMASGLPVALSDAAMIGDFVRKVDPAWTFSPSVAAEWDRVFALLDDDAAVEAGGRRARYVYEENFAPDDARSLIAVYQGAIDRRG